MAYDLSQRIAEWVKAELAATGRTQAQLAHHLGITQPNVSRRLRNDRPFQLQEMTKVAEFFGTTVDAVIGGRAVGNSGQHAVSPAPTLQGRAGKQRTAGPTRGHDANAGDAA